MEQIKILHVGSALGSGGVERLLLNIYTSLDQTLFHFDFITHYPEGMIEEKFKAMGSNIYHLPLRRKHPFRCMAMAYRIFKDTDYGIIHFHGTFDMVPYVFLAYCAGKKIRICHSHTFFLKPTVFQRAYMGITHFCLGLWGTCFIACGEAAAKWGLGNRIIQKRDFHIIHNAIDCDDFRFVEQRCNEMRSKLKLNDDFTILHVGRLSVTKNQTFFLRIFADILKHFPSAKYLLVGEGELENELKLLTQNLNIQNSVRFLGVRNDIADLMQAADALVLPSLNEGFPVVLVEAQAAGMHCFISERISKETELTSLVKFIPLAQPEKWVEALLQEMRHPMRREDMHDVIRGFGYDAPQEFSMLSQLYLNLCGNSDNKSLGCE